MKKKILLFAFICGFMFVSCTKDDEDADRFPVFNSDTNVYSFSSDTIIEVNNSDYNFTYLTLCSAKDVASDDSTYYYFYNSVISSVDFNKRDSIIKDGNRNIGKVDYDVNGDVRGFAIDSFCTVTRGSLGRYNKVYYVNKTGNNPDRYYLKIGVIAPKCAPMDITVK